MRSNFIDYFFFFFFFRTRLENYNFTMSDASDIEEIKAGNNSSQEVKNKGNVLHLYDRWCRVLKMAFLVRNTLSKGFTRTYAYLASYARYISNYVQYLSNYAHNLSNYAHNLSNYAHNLSHYAQYLPTFH